MGQQKINASRIRMCALPTNSVGNRCYVGAKSWHSFSFLKIVYCLTVCYYLYCILFFLLPVLFLQMSAVLYFVNSASEKMINLSILLAFFLEIVILVEPVQFLLPEPPTTLCSRLASAFIRGRSGHLGFLDF